MIKATDGFENDIRTLYRYGVEKAELPVKRVADFIDAVEVFADRLKDLCPIKENDHVLIKTADGEREGNVNGIAIKWTDGKALVATDVYDEYIPAEEFDRVENNCWVWVESKGGANRCSE